MLRVEKLASEGKISLPDVLLVAAADGSQVEVGTPTAKGQVTAEITKQGRARKITVVHYKAKVRYHKKYGHRQPFTELKVSAVP